MDSAVVRVKEQITEAVEAAVPALPAVLRRRARRVRAVVLACRLTSQGRRPCTAVVAAAATTISSLPVAPVGLVEVGVVLQATSESEKVEQ